MIGTHEVPPHQVGNPDVGHSDIEITVYKWLGCQPLLIKCFKMIIGIQSSIREGVKKKIDFF